MSIDSAIAFRAYVNEHPEIHAEVKTALLGNTDLGAIGTANGFDFTDAESREAMNQVDASGELSDFELDMVAGGEDFCDSDT